MKSKAMDLFGGDEKWDPSQWTDSDDRVRGGASQSYLKCSPDNPVAKFHGDLDIKTLGGAGFASQRTTGIARSWDLSSYDGIRIAVKKSDSKRYTFNVKDELLPKLENGREQSTISYEYDFQVPENATLSSSHTVIIPWSSLSATYRGKEKKDAPKLRNSSIKRFGIMMRSFFGEQEGQFSLQIESITAICLDANAQPVENVQEKRNTDGPATTSSESSTEPFEDVLQPRVAPTNNPQSVLKTALLTVLGLSAIAILFVRFPGASATGWAAIASCAHKWPRSA